MTKSNLLLSSERMNFRFSNELSLESLGSSEFNHANIDISSCGNVKVRYLNTMVNGNGNSLSVEQQSMNKKYLSVV